MVKDHGQMAIELNSKASIAGNVYTVPVRLDAKHQAMLDQLNAASADQFDKLYVQMMRQTHKDTYELLNAMADRGALANFNEFAADNKDTVLHHLQEADKLAMDLNMGMSHDMSGSSSM
jgi:putative membrane protein